MPGLLGLVSPQAEPQLVKLMLAAINHHNYSIKTHQKEDLFIGHVNIRDGEQWLSESSDQNILVAVYGKLFSKNEGLSSAASLFQHLERHNFNALSSINGQYCAFVHNAEQNKSYLISDRFGTHPLYYTVRNNRLLFAPELKALLKDAVTRQINLPAVSELFSYGHLFGNKTLFEGIHLLPPATILEFNGQTVNLREYWRYPYDDKTYANEPIKNSVARALDETLGTTLIQAARRQIASREELLLPLSGGLDSRYVAALYHQLGLRKVTTFTMGPDESEDQRYASKVAEQLQFPHNRFPIDPQKIWHSAKQFSYLADGMSYISGPIQILEPLEHFAGNKSVVPISQMCDALFGSTLWRKRIWQLRLNKRKRSDLDKIVEGIYVLYNSDQVRSLFRPEIYARMKGLHVEAIQPYLNQNEHPLHNYFRLLMNEHGRRGTLGGNVIINSLYETRMISYDNDLFDFGWQLPVAYREHQYLYRRTFTRLFPELARINRQGLNLKIGASLLQYDLKTLEKKIATTALRSALKPIAKLYKPWNRPSYVDYSRWFRENIREEIVQFLTIDKLASSELVNPDAVKRLVYDHVNGKQDNTSLLWQVVNLEHFYRNFIR